MSNLSRWLTGALAAGLLCPTAAEAATTKVADGRLIDATSDGRYVLVDIDGSEQGTLIDRSSGRRTELPFYTALDLADRAPRVLLWRGNKLSVFDLATGKTTVASLGPSGEELSTERGQLVRNGTAVIFVTKENVARIVEHDLITRTSTVRVATDVDLRFASEDGRVVTWFRTLPRAQRPATSIPHRNDPYGGVTATAVGYQVSGDAPRVLQRSSFVQTRLDAAPTSCESSRLGGIEVIPNELQVAQNGAGGYLLAAGSYKRVLPQGTFYERTTIVDASGTRNVQDTETGTLLGRTLDPRSARWSWKGVLYSSAGIAYPLGGGDATSRIVPMVGRAGAIYGVAASATRGPEVFYNDLGGAQPGVTSSQWIALPRPGDAVDSAATAGESTWVECGVQEPPPPADTRGTFADYAKISVKTSGNSAGSVAVNLTPAGKLAAWSANARVSWLGMQLSNQLATRSQTITLPSIPAWISGYRVDVAVNFQGYAPLTGGATLRRNS